MMTLNRILRGALVACVLAPAWSAAPAWAAARVKKERVEKFQCVGVGRGHHAKNMTEAQCLKAGGTIERGGNKVEKTPPASRARGEKKEARRAPDTGDAFSCRGIGTGHHTIGMTREDCVRQGGTVELPR